MASFRTAVTLVALGLVLGVSRDASAQQDLADVNSITGPNGGASPINIESALDATGQSITANDIDTGTFHADTMTAGIHQASTVRQGFGRFDSAGNPGLDFLLLSEDPLEPFPFLSGPRFLYFRGFTSSLAQQVAYVSDFEEHCRTIRLDQNLMNGPVDGVYIFGRDEEITRMQCTSDDALGPNPATVSVRVAGKADVFTSQPCNDSPNNLPNTAAGEHLAEAGDSLDLEIIALNEITRITAQICSKIR